MGEFRVIASTSTWGLGGAQVFSANLVRGLRALGVQAELLITADPPRNTPGYHPLSSPPDIELSRLPLAAYEPLKPGRPMLRRWAALLSYLERRAPCVYVPSYDYWHSCVCPKLSGRVAVVGVVHCDEPSHYEEINWLGKYFDAVVAGAKTIEEKLANSIPDMRPRLFRIPYGTPVPERPPARPERDDPRLRIMVACRLSQRQKRVLDLPGIASALAERGVPFRLTIAGDGGERDQLLKGLAPFLADGRVEYRGIIPTEDFPGELERQDVFLLTSDFEGMPLALLDAMARGCVPVVTDIASGIPELVQDGVNGYRVPVGDVARFADKLSELQRDVGVRRSLSLAAYETVSRGFRVEHMVGSYLDLFRRVLRDAASGAFRRPRGRILLQPSLAWMQPTWKDRLPEPIRGAAGWCKRLLRRTWAAAKGGPRVSAAVKD